MSDLANWFWPITIAVVCAAWWSGFACGVGVVTDIRQEGQPWE